MSVLTLYVLTALTTVLTGLASGWWLRSRSIVPQEMPVDQDEVRRARELLSALRKMASGVAVDLGEHTTQVSAINEELNADGFPEPAKLLGVVTRLVDVNKTMQGRLESAEVQLLEQVRLVESHTAEARTDALTLVGNRRAFESDIEQCLSEHRRTGQVFSLAMIDLDKFKRLNDTYGHQAGDEVLRGTGRVLRRVMRETDTIARYGGEEFVVIFNRSSMVEVQRAMSRLRKSIEKNEFVIPDGKLNVTISMGAAQVAEGDSAATLLERADAALYASKEAGRNRGHWHDGTKILPIVEEQAKPPIRIEVPKMDESVKPAATAATTLPGTEEATPQAAGDLPELLNRTAFCQHVRSRMAEWKRGGPTLTLVLVEIDQFDKLTNRFGPKFRDLLVTCLTRVVVAGVRDMDMIARYNAGCLGFILPKAEIADSIRVADRIREACSQLALPIDGNRVNFTVSGGLIEVVHADDMIGLFGKAEKALDAAHQLGGNCLFQHDGKRCLPARELVAV